MNVGDLALPDNGYGPKQSTTVYNPNVAGNPFMGDNSAQANSQANSRAGNGNVQGQTVQGTPVNPKGNLVNSGFASPSAIQQQNLASVTSGTGQALSQAKGLPNLSTSSTGLGVGNGAGAPAPTQQQQQNLMNATPKASQPPIAPAATPPSPTAYPQDQQGQQQLQNATQQYNQANPQAPVPTAPLKTQPVLPSIQQAQQNFDTALTDGKVNNSSQATQPTVDTGDAGANQQIALTQANNTTFQSQSQTLENANVASQGALQDETTQAAQNQYTAEQANLNQFATQAAQSKDALNAAAQAQDVAGRADAQDQYNNDMLALKFQQANTDETFNTQIAQQQTQDQQQVIQQESSIAALGGYGNLTQMRNLMFTYQQNNLAMNQLVMNKNNADQDITGQILQTNKSYNDNLNQVEATKQSAIADNYAKYTDYVQTVMEDKNKSEDDKYTAITQAAKDYTTNVAKVHGDALTARHDASVASATEVDRLRQQQIANQRSNLQLSTFTDNNGNVTLVGTDTRTGKMISQNTLKGAGASLPMTLQYNPYTTETNVFDPNTGKVVIPGSNMASTNYFNNLPAGTSQVGGSVLQNTDINKIFGVGGVGGWCGAFANSLTTGPKVGDSWDSKISAATIKPGTAGFDPSTVKPGMEMVLPEGVKKDQGYGHVVTILSYDPATGTINTVQSNGNGEKNTGKGPGHVTTQSYNLADLTKQYGSNFGMVPTSFKPSIQSQLDGAAMPFTPPVPPSSGSQTGLNPNALNGLPPTLATYVQNVSSGAQTMDMVPSALQPAVNTALKIYNPSYSQVSAAANAQAQATNITASANTHASLLTTASQNLIGLQASEQAADASLDNLSQLHAKLPGGSQITFLNNALQELSGKVSNDASAAFGSAYTDALQQAGIVITNGNAVTENTGKELQGGLPADLDQKAFDAAIQAVKSTMSNKVKAANDQVLQLQSGQNIATPDTSTTGQSATDFAATKASVTTAIAQGHNPQDIVKYMLATPSLAPLIQKALDQKYTPEEIVQYYQ